MNTIPCDCKGCKRLEQVDAFSKTGALTPCADAVARVFAMAVETARRIETASATYGSWETTPVEVVQDVELHARKALAFAEDLTAKRRAVATTDAAGRPMAVN